MAVPYPGLWNQAQQLAQQQLGGQIRSTRRASRRETRAGERFIRQLAHSFAGQLQGLWANAGDPYDQMERESAAAASAMSNYLSGQGEALSANLGQELSYAGPAAQRQFAGGQRQLGLSMGRNAAAAQAQQMQNLVGAEGDIRAQAQVMPGIAALTGIQSAEAFESQQARDLRSQVEQLQSQQPGLAAEFYNSFAAQRLAQQQMAQQERFHEDEMAAAEAARRQAEAEAAVGRNTAAQERWDTVRMNSLEFMQNFIPGPDPLTGEPREPDAGEMMSAARSYWKQFYPNKGKGWINAQAQRTVESFGVADPARMAGLLGQVMPQSGSIIGAAQNPSPPSAMSSQPGYRPTGATPGLTAQPSPMQGGTAFVPRGQQGMNAGARPPVPSVYYSNQSQFYSQPSQGGTSRIHWEGPGYYRLSNGWLIRTG